MYPSAVAVLPAVYESEPADFAPPLLPDRFDELTAYVASSVATGRRLFDVLADPFVADRADEYLSLLDHLAGQPAIRAALARTPRTEPAAAGALAA